MRLDFLLYPPGPSINYSYALPFTLCTLLNKAMGLYHSFVRNFCLFRTVVVFHCLSADMKGFDMILPEIRFLCVF